ncbi:uncharacterized protein LOC131630931 [Vicia villosa]|uniref:uncharacterized protein LOC131630931 n=1 Tax=Vicia villosa TaxID=3911 RepID=UPI00273B4F93|nr:uncharacterized protein LOC131630931 [Vicia villosa]
MEAMGGVSVDEKEDDSFRWMFTNNGVFSVKSCYDLFKSSLSGPPLDSKKVLALSFLWNCKVPSKILVFGWRFIHNRLATKDQLVRRGVLVEGSESLCSMCKEKEEDILHLFFKCDSSCSIWRRVYMWLDLANYLSFEDFEDFFINYDKLPVNKRMMVAIIWLATAWSIWSKRNAVIFRKESFNFTECMSEIIHNSWRWFSSFQKKKNVCNFYLWNIRPLDCSES